MIRYLELKPSYNTAGVLTTVNGSLATHPPTTGQRYIAIEFDPDFFGQVAFVTLEAEPAQVVTMTVKGTRIRSAAAAKLIATDDTVEEESWDPVIEDDG